MRDRELYARILGIETPWQVDDVELRLEEQQVEVRVGLQPGTRPPCPECGTPCSIYDHHHRRWRHLDTCQLQTVLTADVPRIHCDQHGVLQVRVPWAEPGSHFTALFEALVIDWLRQASMRAVSQRLRLSWRAVDTIQQRAVVRGLARRDASSPRRIGVDETSFQKRHEYVTVVSDLVESRVLFVADDRKAESLSSFYESLSVDQRQAIECVAMDMWAPYIKATVAAVPDASTKISFDRFHVAGCINKAVDEVRKKEHRELRNEGSDRLKGTKYRWLMGRDRRRELRTDVRRAFNQLIRSALKTARAWALKETANGLWSYRSRTWAEKAWKLWITRALRSRLEPVRKAARTIREHLWGILNAVLLAASNATAESLNARIQKIKAQACGFRNRDRFRTAILFHLGGLDLYPQTLATHSNR
jgi:transposase